MKYLFKWTTALLLGLLYQGSWGQVVTYKITRQLDPIKAYRLNIPEHGIKASFYSGDGRKATVKVRTTRGGSYTDGCSTIPLSKSVPNILLYEAYVDNNTGGAYLGTGHPEESYKKTWGLWVFSPCGHVEPTNSKAFIKRKAIFADWVLNGMDASGWRPWPIRDEHIEVTIELTLKGQVGLDKITGIKFPGLPELTGADFQPEPKVEYRINAGDWENLSNSTLRTTVGNEIEFRIPKSIVADINKARFNKLPGIWVARFGWDVMYYQTESVNPGDYKPFLGFDSQVHTVAFRQFKDYFHPDGKGGYKIKEDDWRSSGDFWIWSYTVPVRMDASKEEYSPIVNWEVTKKAGDINPVDGNPYPKTQRHDQRRGSNMNLLNRWPNAFDESGLTNNDFTGDYSGPKFFVGLDPDEFVYVDRYETEVTSGDGLSDVLYVEGYPWHELLPQEKALVDAGQNNQADDLALSYMVTAYQRQQSRKGDYPMYQGHEVQEEGLFIKSDGSPCTGLTDCFYKNPEAVTAYHAAPGKDIELNVEGRAISFSIQANSPQGSNDPGFYPSIVGTEWPSAWEQNVPYTLKGLQGLNDTQIESFFLELQYEDELGYLNSKRIFPKTNFNKIRTSGKWTTTFDMKGFGNYNINAGYSPCKDCEEVIIGGKELNLVDLRFLAVNEPGTNWDGSKGPGAYWYMQDTIREYTVTKGQQLNFSIMDSDPHTFRPDGTEFYISNRAKAKRIPNDSLSGDNGYLKWYITSGIDARGWGGTDTPIGNGLNTSHQFNSNGLYGIKVLYRNTSYVTHLIRVVDYEYGDATDNLQKGEIALRAPSPSEAKWLRQSSYNLDGMKIASVKNVLSHYTYTESSVRGKGSYDPENEFLAEYEWYDQNNNKLDPTPIYFDQNNIFPHTWVRHTEGANWKGKGVDDPKIIKLNEDSNWSFEEATIEGLLENALAEAPEYWDLRLPWIATTNTHGFQVRNNVKSVFGMKKLFSTTDGGFTGKGNTKNLDEVTYKDKVSTPFPFTEEQMEWQKFFEDLEHGRKILINKDVTALTVKNAGINKDNKEFDHFIASRPVNLQSEFIKGADMSNIPNLEDKAIKWTVDGQEKDPYKILSDFGMNTVRIRLWVDPKYGVNATLSGEYPYSKLFKIINDIKRSHNHGLDVLLDLHLSDDWTDPAQNIIPDKWKVNGNMPTTDLLRNSIYQHVFSVLSHLQTKNALPELIQIGNETNSNILLSAPYDELTKEQVAAEIGVSASALDNKYTINWDRNAKLLNVGLQAVEDFNVDLFQEQERIKTILHVAGPSNLKWWMQQASNRDQFRLGTEKVNFGLVDYVGMSYYPTINNESFSDVGSIIEDIYQEYGLKTILLETAYPATYSYSDNTTNMWGAYEPDNPYNHNPKNTSPTAQKDWLTDLISILRATEGSAGLLYWEPFWVGSNDPYTPMKDDVGSNWEHMSFFDFQEGSPTFDNPLNTDGGIAAFCEGNCPQIPAGLIAKNVAILGNLACNTDDNMAKVKSLIDNTIKPGKIITLGNTSYPTNCNSHSAFYASYDQVFQDHLDAALIFPTTGPLDYKYGGTGVHAGTTNEAEWLNHFNRNETYYKFASNDVEYFVINTNNRQGPGTDPVNDAYLKKVMEWLEKNVKSSTAKYQIVLAHHSPHLTNFESTALQNWNYKDMGVDLYVSAGAAFYERHDVDGVPFVNVGLGGKAKNKHDFSGEYASTLVPGTHYAKKDGVLSATVGNNMMMFQFINVEGEKIDQFYLINREDQQPGRVDYYYLENRRGTELANTAEALDVWIILGQSNAEGRCESNYCYDEFSGDEIGELTDTYLLNEKGTFENAKNALARYSSVGKIQFTQSIAFGWTFAQELNDAGHQLGLIVNPAGGTDLAEWMPDYQLTAHQKAVYGKYSSGYGGQTLFEETIRRVQDARAMYPNLNIKGVLWAQGENDAERVYKKDLNYTKGAVTMIKAFRTQLGIDDLKFLISEVSPRNTDCEPWCHTELNKQIKEIPNQTSNAWVASTSDLQTFDDINVHWTHSSYRTLGKRLAALVLNPPSSRMQNTEEVPDTTTDNLKWMVEVYPNPVAGNVLNVKVDVVHEGDYHLTLVDMDGRILMATDLWLGEGTNHTLLSVESVASGPYVLTITNGVDKHTETLIIQH